MKFLIAVALILLVAGTASAQTHPCDVTPTSNPVITKKTVVVGFCHDQKDLNGDPTTLTAVKIQMDGTLVNWTNPTPTSATANAAGKWYYEAPSIQVNRGTHAVTVVVSDLDGDSAATATFPFTTKGPGPKVATDPRAR
jgi:hypothetical protein